MHIATIKDRLFRIVSILALQLLLFQLLKYVLFGLVGQDEVVRLAPSGSPSSAMARLIGHDRADKLFLTLGRVE